MTSRRRVLWGEKGQGLVEFALILPVLLALVLGMVAFGKALVYWLDMNRVANEGARWAVVNQFPGCDLADPPLPSPPCSSPTLAEFVRLKLVGGELNTGGTSIKAGQSPRETACVVISFPSKTQSNPGNNVGDPVEVSVIAKYRWLPFVNVLPVTLRGSATMRLELKPTHFTATPQAIGVQCGA